MEKYVGEWKNGSKEGFGVFHYYDGSKYEGEWKNDTKFGKGSFTLFNGDVLSFRDISSDSEKLKLSELVIALHSDKQELELVTENLKLEKNISHSSKELLQLEQEQKDLRRTKHLEDDLRILQERLRWVEENHTKAFEEFQQKCAEREDRLKQTQKQEVSKKLENVTAEWKQRLEKEKKKKKEAKKQLEMEQAARRELEKEVKELKASILEKEKSLGKKTMKYQQDVESIQNELRQMELHHQKAILALEDERATLQRTLSATCSKLQHSQDQLSTVEKKLGILTGRTLENLTISDLEDLEETQALAVKAVSQKKVYLLKERIRQEEDCKTCKICFEQKINTALIPCGHCVVCIKCSKGLKQCCICRTEIHQITSIFYS